MIKFREIAFFIVVFNFSLTLFAEVEKIPSKNLVLDCKNFNQKKKILIFSSKGGAGHTSVSYALKEYLDESFNIEIINIFDELLHSLDPFKYFTFGRSSGEDFYNFCVQYRWTGIISCLVKFGAWGLIKKQNTIEELILKYIEKTKPNLLISVIPLINFAILNVAQKKNIPFLVVTNDLDTTNYINGISKPTYKKFYYTLSFDDPDLWKKIEPAVIPKEQVKITGFPLRSKFCNSNFDKSSIHKEFDIPENKKKIMLLMGGAGSISTYRYVRTLSRYKDPIHIIACLGKNENLRSAIEKIVLPSHVSITIVGFTSSIAELMSISDVFITKPGPGSVCEALALKVPMIIDKTNGTLWWELMNITFIEKHQFGDVSYAYKNLNNIIDKYLSNNQYVESIKKKMANFKERNQFESNIKKLVKEIMD